MQQADDFLEESRCLADIVNPLDAEGLQRITQFKGWSIEDVIGHLHMFNHAAELALRERDLFRAFFAPMAKDLNAGKSLLSVQNDWLNGLGGIALVEQWITGFQSLGKIYKTADPKQRIAWAGPDMSARSSITARQMETWAHGQEVFDVLGLKRKDTDRIRNIAHLGVSTYGWTFSNRNMAVPDPPPFVRLTAPSGQIWEWNTVQDNNCVEGSAVGFCQIVTQTRNLADTDVRCTGNNAVEWMGRAQCFAGPPVKGPVAGARFCQ